MKTRIIEVGQNLCKLTGRILFCGEDLLIAITGGDTPHIGAVALAVPRASLADSEKKSSSASVLCRVNHKEDEWARWLALEISRTTNRCAVITIGIHIDHISSEQMGILRENFYQLVALIEQELEKERYLCPDVLKVSEEAAFR